MEEKTFWYKVEFKENSSVFIETLCGVEELYKLIASNRAINVLRRIVPMMSKEQLSFITQDKIDPLLQFCKKDSCYLNGGNILYFTEIDTEGEMWKKLANAVLGENNIATPSKKLILPD